MIEKTTQRIAVTPWVKQLMNKAKREVAVETHGKIIGVNESLQYILEKFLERGE